jgi:NADH-quinone oxidoreductase subunit H
LWFIGKLLVFLFVFIWLRGTLPRMRYDQFMALGWKVLVPGSLIWIVLVSGARTLRSAIVTPSEILMVGGIVLVMLLVVAFLLPPNSAAQRDLAERTREVPTTGSDYPLPPLDLAVPPPPPRRAAISAAMSAAVSANGGPPTSQEDDHRTA